MNRVVATLTLLVGLSAMMVGIYAEQWTRILDLVRPFIPFIG